MGIVSSLSIVNCAYVLPKHYNGDAVLKQIKTMLRMFQAKAEVWYHAESLRDERKRLTILLDAPLFLLDAPQANIPMHGANFSFLRYKVTAFFSEPQKFQRGVRSHFQQRNGEKAFGHDSSYSHDSF